MTTQSNNAALSFDVIAQEISEGENDSLNRLARMVKCMFDSPATFGKDFVASFHSFEGIKKTQFVDGKLIAVSPTFKKLVAMVKAAKDSDDNKEKKAAIVDNCNARITAIRQMFTRATVCVHKLQHLEATELKVRNDGRMIATHPEKDAKGNIDMIPSTFTGRELTKAGEKVGPPKKTRAAAGAVDVTELNEKSLKASTGFIDTVLRSEENGTLAALSDDVIKNDFQPLLIKLLRRQFPSEKIDNGIDEEALRKFVMKLNSPPMSAKEAEGVRAKDALPEDEEAKKAEQEAYKAGARASAKTANKRASSKRK